MERERESVERCVPAKVRKRGKYVLPGLIWDI